MAWLLVRHVHITSVFDKGRFCLHCYSTFILMNWLVWAMLIIAYLLLHMLMTFYYWHHYFVTALQNIFHQCELELKYLDMAVNPKKTHCIQIGPRCSANCANISTCEGRAISWVCEVRYLGIFIICSRHFKCTLDNAKRSFYSAVNGILGKLLTLLQKMSFFS